MNEYIASLIIPFIDTDLAWVNVVLGVNKKYTEFLDKECNWEDHFGIKCADLQSDQARFRFIRYVQCNKRKLPTSNASIAKRYAITFVSKPGMNFACSVIPQFFLVCDMLEAYFPDDDVPFTQFSCEPPTAPKPMRCGSVHCVAEIFIKKSKTPCPLIEGNLDTLYAELSEEPFSSSDECFECSECGEERHSVWDF